MVRRARQGFAPYRRTPSGALIVAHPGQPQRGGYVTYSWPDPRRIAEALEILNQRVTS